MSSGSVAADVAAAAASLAGQNTAPVQATDETPVAGEVTAEALHGRAPDAGEHDQGQGQGRDEYGRYTPKTKDKEKVTLVHPSKKAESPAKPADVPAPPATPDAAKAPEAKTEPAEPAAKPNGPALVPPRNLKPLAREKWADVPRAMQEEFIRVNREAQTALTKSDKERQYAEGIRTVLQPYEHMLRAEGLDAPAAIGDLLKTAAMLRTGTQAQKAAWVADTINRFGIDVDGINNSLNGPQNQAGAQMAAPAQYHDPRVDQLIAQQQKLLAQQEQAEQAARAAAQALSEKQQAEIEDFGAKHEFFEDVRAEMAFEFDRAKALGKPLTLDAAYARVLTLHEKDPDSEIGKVLRQRAEAAAAKASIAQSQQAKAAAAVSVKAEPAPVAVPTGTGTALDDVRAAVARLSQ